MNRRAIASFIESSCANYDEGGKCLLETDAQGGRQCPYFTELPKRCKYAETHVLPANPELLEPDKPSETCLRCAELYQRKSNRQKYCEPCATDMQKRRAREHMQKVRAVQ